MLKNIISKYSKVYSTLVGNNPKSYIDLTLGELKSINIHFVGFVNIPGVHVVHPFSSVISGLFQAGGVNEKGSLREIIVLRNGEKIASIDFYEYFMNGKSSDDFRLMDQDIIFVPPRKSSVPISGRVLRPGYYEILMNEKLSDLVSYSGGFDQKASNYIFAFSDGIEKNSNIIKNNKLNNFSIFRR